MSTISSATQTPSADSCQGFITALVLRCGLGDEAALGELFDLTFFLVSAAVRRGALSTTGADDEVVEAFRRIWHRSAAYEATERGVLAWVLEQAVAEQAAPSADARLSA